MSRHSPKQIEAAAKAHWEYQATQTWDAFFACKPILKGAYLGAMRLALEAAEQDAP